MSDHNSDNCFVPVWSVASAFDRWSEEGVYGDQWQVALAGEPRAETVITCEERTDVVAEAIRGLGYIVTCRKMSGTVMYLDEGVGGGDGYIIFSIQRPSGEFVYGCSDEEAPEGGLHQLRPLEGHRRYYDWLEWNVNKCIIGHAEMKRARWRLEGLRTYDGWASKIDDALVAGYDSVRKWRNMWAEGEALPCSPTRQGRWHEQAAHSTEDVVAFYKEILRETGFSTIGNVGLPDDIIELLRDFKHDDFGFRKELPIEFTTQLLEKVDSKNSTQLLEKVDSKNST